MSTPPNHQRIEELFFAALLEPPAQRSAFLDRHCRADTELREAVERRLAQQQEPPDFLEKVIGNAAEGLDCELLASTRPRRFGVYSVLRELGRGGLGTVYLAERVDGEFRRRVALKVLRRGLDTEDVLRRFRAERQILAQLEHPNIARLHDGGSTDTGLPYFVMEHIDGLAIDRYCDLHQLSVMRRLDLFRQVCVAVQYAHQNLVVHRDLKPSNILVTPDGVPKLLDFGIAKLLAPTATEASMQRTATSLRPMTPTYASPEQVRGDPITTASDVYTLGTLLYELLSGQRPIPLQGDEPIHRLEELVCEHEPVEPSVAVRQAGSPGLAGLRPAQLERQLRGDLDRICLQALRKEPSRRYASVEQLAQDVLRYQQGRPVTARPDTAGYRLGKFLRRNRLAVAAAAAASLLVVTFAAVTMMQSVQVRQQRDRAAEVSRMLIDLFNIANPDTSRGSTITARELLDRGTAQVAELAPSLETAELAFTLAHMYRKLGLYDHTAPLLRRALEIQQQHLGEEHADVATTLFQLGLDQAEAGNFQAASGHLRQALDLRLLHFGLEHKETIRIVSALALLEHDLGHYQAAEELYDQAYRTEQHLLGSEHLRPMHTRGNFALLQRDMGAYRQAAEIYRHVLEVYRRELGDDNLYTVSILDDLGVTLHELGDFEEAEALLRRALEQRRQSLGEEHSTVGVSLMHLGALLCDTGELETAESLLRRALEIHDAAGGEDHPYKAQILESLGRCRGTAGDRRHARELLEQAVAVHEAQLSAEHPLTGRALLELATLLERDAECAQAEPLLQRVLHIYNGALDLDNWQLHEARGVLAACRAGDADTTPTERAAALRQLQRSRAHLHDALGPQHLRTLRAERHWAQLQEPASRSDEAPVVAGPVP